MKVWKGNGNRNRRTVRYAAAFLAAIVVFATTYALILPAITLDSNTAQAEAGIELVQQEEPEEIETEADEPETVSAKEDAAPEQEETAPSEEGEKEPETAKQTSDPDEEKQNKKEPETKASSTKPAASSKQAEFPAQIFEAALKKAGKSASASGVVKEDADKKADEKTDADKKLFAAISVEAEEGAFPAGTTMKITDVSKDKDVKASVADAVDGQIASLQAFDISFYNKEGKKIEPEKEIKVSVISDKFKQKDDPEILHLPEKGGKPEHIDALDERKLDEKPAEDEVVFTSDSFSVYAFVYTVDFSYSVNGQMYDVSLPGGEKIALSELIEVLGILQETQFEGVGEFISHISDVEFSDNSLVKVTHKTPALGVFGDEDWVLESLKAFDTEETLTITMDNGDVVTVKVTDDQEHDLTGFIKSVQTYKINENGKATPATSFNDGDKARIQINYTVGSGEITGRTMTYQLPQGITVPTNITRDLYDANGNKVGSFTASTNGSIIVQYDDSHDINSGFDGYLILDCVVKNVSGGDDNKINFTDNISITVNPPAQETNSDLSINKSSTLDEANKKINYEITISSKKGSADVIDFTDWLYVNSVTATYNLVNGQRIAITKTNESGQTTTIYATVELDQANNSFRLSDLPKLAANETYTFNYTTHYGDVTGGGNGSASVSNSARATDGPNGETKTSYQQIQKQQLGKWGSLEDGKVKWTISIGTEGQDLSGYRLDDKLTQDGTQISLPNSIKVNGNDVTVSSWPYTFPQGTSGVVTVTYYTEFEDNEDGSKPKFHNEASVTVSNGGPTYEYKTDYQPGQEPVPEEKYDVTKWAPTTVGEDIIFSEDGSTATLEWSSRIDMPKDQKDLGQLTYTDKMMTNNSFGDLSGEHYTTIGLLKELTIWSDTNTLVRGTDYVIYDSNGVDISDQNNDTIVSGFTVRFLSADKFANLGYVSLRYKTIAQLNMNVGEKWTFINRAKIPSAQSRVEWDYTRNGDLDKQSSSQDKDGQHRSNENNTYASGKTEIDYADGIIYYRLVLDTHNTTQSYTYDIHVTDFLPEGLEYVDGSLDAYYRGDSVTNETPFNVYDVETKTKDNDNSNHSLEKNAGNLHESYDAATRTLSVTIDTASKYARYIELYYQARVNDPDYWSVEKNTKKIYSNHATWGTSTDYEDVVVTHEEDKVSKVGAKATITENVDGKSVKRTVIKYGITVNPQGLDLVPYTDSIVVTDILTMDSNNAVAQFMPETFRVYRYDKNADDKKGVELSSSRYQFTYDAQEAKITATVPDEMPLLIEYQYEFPVLDGINATTVENTAQITGVAGSSSKDTQEFSTAEASGGVSRKELTVYKVDANDYTKKLPGAKFKLERFAKASESNNWTGTWEQIQSNESDGLFTVDSRGKLYVNGPDNNMQDDELFRLTEVQAPTDYTKSDEVQYFGWKSNNETDTANEFYNMTGYGWHNNPPSEIKKLFEDNEVYFAPDSLTYYIQNEYQHIDLHKVWTDNDGIELTDMSSVPAASFTLYRQAKELDARQVNVLYRVIDSNQNISWRKEQTIAVAKGSGLTITLNHSWMNNVDDGFLIDDGSSSYHVNAPGDYNNGNSTEGYRPVVITYDSIDSDMNIVISHGNQQWEPILSNYTPPYEYNIVPGTKSVVKSNISLNSGNNWTTTITDDLEKTVTVNGKTYTYYYWLEEDSVPAGWTASYSVGSDSGVPVGGEITVTNRKDKEEPNTTQIKLNKVWDSDNHGGNTEVTYYVYRTTVEPEYKTVTLRYPVETNNDTGHTDKVEMQEKSYQVLKGSDIELFVTHVWWDPYPSNLYDIKINGTKATFSAAEQSSREIQPQDWVKYEEHIFNINNVTDNMVIELDYKDLNAEEFMVPVIEERPNDSLVFYKQGTIKTDGDNNWTTTITGLDKYADPETKQQPYYYFIYEEDLDFDDKVDLTRFDTTYSHQYVNAATETNPEVTITNTIRPEYTWLQIQKAWDSIADSDKPEAGVSVVLYRRAKTESSSTEPHWYDQINITKNGLRETIDGHKYDVEAVGQWAGGWYALDPNYDYFIAETNIKGEWYSNAPYFISYTDAAGKEITPLVFENNRYYKVETGGITGGKHNHATITNSSTEVKFTKAWEGDTEGKYTLSDGTVVNIADLVIQVQLEQYINGSKEPIAADQMRGANAYDARKVIELDGTADTGKTNYYEDSAWHAVWKNLPAASQVNDKREDYTYKIKELGVYLKSDTERKNNLIEEFTVTPSADGKRITNRIIEKEVPTTDVTVNKSWLNKDASTDWPTGVEVEMTLYREEIGENGEKALVKVEGTGITNPVKLTAEEGKQSYTWEDLPETLSDGTKITYVVKETAVTGYTSYATTADGSEKSDTAEALAGSSNAEGEGDAEGEETDTGLTASFLNRENEGGKVNIQITKYITDADGKPIELVADVANKFTVLTSTTDTNPDNVIDVNKNEYKSEYSNIGSYTDKVADTEITVSYESNTEDPSKSATTGSVYVNDLEGGMYTITEDPKSIPDKIYDKSGKVYQYKQTILETEYAWRENGDEGARHWSKTYTKTDNKLIAIPEAAGAYGDGLYNGYLDFYVTNVYEKVNETVTTETLNLELDKAWDRGGDAIPPASGSVTFELHQVETTVTTTTSGSGSHVSDSQENGNSDVPGTGNITVILQKSDGTQLSAVKCNVGDTTPAVTFKHSNDYQDVWCTAYHQSWNKDHGILYIQSNGNGDPNGTYTWTVSSDFVDSNNTVKITIPDSFLNKCSGMPHFAGTGSESDSGTGTGSNTSTDVKEDPDGSGFPKTVTLTADDKSGNLWKHVEDGLLSKVTSISGDITITKTYTYYVVETGRTGLASAYSEPSISGKGSKSNPISGTDGSNHKVTINAKNTVPNPNDKFIIVKKTWLDEDGNELLNHPDEVLVDVYRIKLPVVTGGSGGISYNALSPNDVFGTGFTEAELKDENGQWKHLTFLTDKVFFDGTNYYYIRKGQSKFAGDQVVDKGYWDLSGQLQSGQIVTRLTGKVWNSPEDFTNENGQQSGRDDIRRGDVMIYNGNYYVYIVSNGYDATNHSNGNEFGENTNWVKIDAANVLVDLTLNLMPNEEYLTEEDILQTYIPQMVTYIQNQLQEKGINWIPDVDKAGEGDFVLYKENVRVSNDDNWQTSFTAEQGYLYFFFEKPIPGFVTKYENQEHGVFDQTQAVGITNTTTVGQLDVTKEWTGDEVTGDQIFVKIFRDGVDITDEIAADASSYGLTDAQFYLRNGHKFLIVKKTGNTWETVSIKDLPIAEYSTNATAYEYSVQEVGYHDTAEGHTGYFWSASDVLTGYSTMVYTRSESTDTDEKKTVTYTAGTPTDSTGAASEGVTVGSVNVEPSTEEGKDPTITFTSGKSLITVKNDSESFGSVKITKTFSGIAASQIPSDFKITATWKNENNADQTRELSISGDQGSDVKRTGSELSYTWEINDLPKGTEVTFTESGYDVAGYTVTTKAGENEGEVTTTATAAKEPGTASFVNTYTDNPKVDIKLLKVDGTDKHALAGSKFSLYYCATSDGTYTIVTELADITLDSKNWFEVPSGGLTIKNLAKGFYKITEEVSPSGYVITEKTPVMFEVTSEGTINNRSSSTVTYKADDKSFTVPNTPGKELPSTGGPGTRLFTILGSILILGAGVLLWRRRRLV